MKKLSLLAGALVAVLMVLSTTAKAQTSLELNWASGPYIDFKNNNVDYDARLRLIDNDNLFLQGTHFYVQDHDLATNGNVHFRGNDANHGEWLMHHPDNGSKTLYLGYRNATSGSWAEWAYQFGTTHMYAKAISIGTGTLPSGYKLAVDGKIMAEEVHVQNSSYWPDFVFADDYALQDLGSVNAFIQENRHLPGVPSAAEVEENGYDLGEMNKILLQKIEELTLHTIRQQEQIEALQAQVAGE